MSRLLTVVLGLLLFVSQAVAATRSVQSPTLDPILRYPFEISYPEYTKPSVEKQYFITLENTYPYVVTFTSVSAIEDSARPSAPSGWLGYSSAPASLPVGGIDSLILELNYGGVVTTGPTHLWGKLRLRFTPPTDSFDIPINFIVADTIVMPEFDTLTTQCGIPLTVATNGNLGNHAIGGVNMGFPFPAPECDSGANNPGDATIYLADASPVIVRHSSLSQYSASWSVFDGDIISPNGFKPLFPGSFRGSFSSSQYVGFNSGTFCTVDSLVKLERTVWAPTGATSADSCHFMIIRTRIFPYMINQSVTNLTIGDLFDFDVPSDSGEIYNVGGTDPTRRLVYVRGFSSEDTAFSNHSCYPNARRYAGAALIKMSTKDCTSQTALYGAYNAANDSFVYPAGTFIPEQLWANMQSSGYSNETRITDLHSMLVYKNVASTGYTLPANDTLTIWTAVAVTRPTGGTSANGLDSLKKEIDKAVQWVKKIPSGCCGCCCCIGTTGNVNKGVAEIPDISDLTLLIAYLTTIPRPILPCICEADINGNGIIDLSDLSLLISYLTQTPRPTLPPCG